MKNKTKLVITLTVGVLALILAFVFHLPKAAQWLATIAGSVVAILMLIDMVKTLRSGKYGIDLLAILAIVATLIVGEYWASLVVLVMLTGGDTLEDYASKKAGQELKSLLDNSPQTAHRLVDGKQQDTAVENVQVGEQLVILPGELVPVDSKIVAGLSEFDESSLTGESRPVTKQVGETVLSGSVNGDAAVTVTAVKTAENSEYQAIVKLVQASESQPAHFVRMADRYAIPFTIISIAIAIGAWLISGDPIRIAEVLVVASPCPLILAAPIALVAGMSRTSKNGIVVKTGTTIEKLAQAKSIAFDKTGTLTRGHLEVDEIFAQAPYQKDEIIHLAASAEQRSGHILARSLVQYVGADTLSNVTNLQEVTAQGIEATVDGKRIKAGKLKFVTDEDIQPLEKTAVYVSVDGKFAGWISFTDQLRPETKLTIDELQRLGVAHRIMLTGDQTKIAETIGSQLNLNEIHGNLLPADKIKILRQIDPEYRPSIMVGDGVNDAPSLTAADVGIAMGEHGATAASESADAVILKGDLTKVASAVVISQDTMRITKTDVITGIIILIVLMLIAATGVIPALVGAMFQEVVDMITILLALRAKNGSRRSQTEMAQLQQKYQTATK
ncbi:heavy metal translocating P-type ATPase [Paucilactobacillus sp. N302-9]|jgi:heavy metal translocating P-type ATPase